MSSSTFISSDSWNKTDDFVLFLSSSMNPLDKGLEGFNEALELVDLLGDELRPNRIYSGKRKRKYSRRVLWDHLDEMDFDYTKAFTLDRTNLPDASVRLHFNPAGNVERFSFDLTINPFSFVQEPRQVESLTKQLTVLVQAFAHRFPIIRGLGHSWTDHCMGKDRPSAEQPRDAPYQEMYWLNVYGPTLVEQLGRERVLSTPATHLEPLPGGAVLFLTRPTPADFASDEARLAQARALVHLHPQLHLDSVLAELRQRSLVFSPLPTSFHEDVADILQLKLEREDLASKRSLVERFNLYHPPPVIEWMSAEQAPLPDVEDVAHDIQELEDDMAQQFISLMQSHKVPHVRDDPPRALVEVDFALWQGRWGDTLDEGGKYTIGCLLGAWLGMHLVHDLGGRWVPRRSLAETAVVVGTRAWLPFVRAWHTLRGGDSPLDFSCTQLFRQARRFAHRSP